MCIIAQKLRILLWSIVHLDSAKLSVVHFNSEDVIATSGFPKPDWTFQIAYYVTGQPSGSSHNTPTAKRDMDNNHNNNNESAHTNTYVEGYEYYWSPETGAVTMASLDYKLPELNVWYDIMVENNNYYWVISPSQ